MVARRRGRVDARRFAALVEEALAAIPPEFARHLENVAVCIEDWPSAALLESLDLDPEVDTLFGLYEGTALPERTHDFAGQPPDRILLFQGPLREAFRDERTLRREIGRTVVHEIAHFFGIDDERVRRLGY